MAEISGSIVLLGSPQLRYSTFKMVIDDRTMLNHRGDPFLQFHFNDVDVSFLLL